MDVHGQAQLCARSAHTHIHTHCRSAFGEMATGNMCGTEAETEGGMRTSAQFPPPAFSAPAASWLDQTVATEELIKATGCTTKPLCCDLSSVTLACFTVPLDLQALFSSTSLWQLRTVSIFTSRTTMTPSFHPHITHSVCSVCVYVCVCVLCRCIYF